MLDYFLKDYLMMIDESHQTIPLVQHVSRDIQKETLVSLASAFPPPDNRPLTLKI